MRRSYLTCFMQALYPKENSNIEELLEQLFKLTGYIWQVGAVVTAFLLFLSYSVKN